MPVQEFIRTERSSGVILIAAAALAFALGELALGGQLFRPARYAVGGGFGAWSLEKPLLLCVNDLLMAVFLFVIGVEIKREILVGELAGWRRPPCPPPGRSAA